MIGQTISHYKILEKLGEGGMGVVYKAQDLKLDRLVALKFLPAHLVANEEQKQRLIREARTASALDHPNIGIIHEVDETKDGEMFIAMAYYEGETLKRRIERGPLPLDEAMEIAIQIGDGLAKAHGSGIVHRDLKPANVIVTNEGIAKIVDFGLAKLMDAARISKSGSTAGTIAYMAPEQIQGKDADARSDMFSFGIVLFEMLTGRTPFRGENEAAMVFSIISDEPEHISNLRPEVLIELEQLLEKALAKRPEQRHENMGELLIDLRSMRKEVESGTRRKRPIRKWILRNRRMFEYGGIAALCALLIVAGLYFTLGVSRKIGSLAVLPLGNLPVDSSYEYFADGMTEELITDLAQIQGLRVISRTTMMRYKGTKKTLPEIGGELKVDGLVEGSVLRIGERVRISVQLIRAATDEHLWAKSYERDLRDVLGLQSEVSLAIAKEIRATVTPQEETRLASARPVNKEAYEFYLKGRYFWNKAGAEQLKKAAGYFQQAIEMDSTFALAYAGLADCFVSNVYGGIPPKKTIPQARAAAMKALAIDSSLAEAHTSLAGVKMHFEWDWFGAERELKRALELNPNYATAHQWYAFNLSMLERHDEAIDEIKRALEIDPMSPFINRVLGSTLLRARRYDQAIEQYYKALELEPNSAQIHYFLGLSYEQKQMHNEAITEYLSALSGERPETLNELKKAFASSGIKGYWLRYLDLKKRDMKQRYVAAYDIAQIYTRLGDKEHTFEWLSRAYDERSYNLVYLRVEPWFDNIRSDPRFTALLNKMGIGRGGDVVHK